MLRQRSISAVFIVIAAVVPAILGQPVLVIAAAALVGLGIAELCRALEQTGSGPAIAESVVLGIVITLTIGFSDSLNLILAVVSSGLLLLIVLRLRGAIEGASRDIAFSVLGPIYVALPLAHVGMIRRLDDHQPATWISTVNGWSPFENPPAGLAWIVLIVGVTWLTDTGAYLGGRLAGRRKLAPNLSPSKTIEGAIAGTLLGVLTAITFSALLDLAVPIYVAAVIGLVLSICGQLGDLVESMIKRDIGIKDMGNLIPGHGGILDRIDALLFTLPAGYYLILVAIEVNWP